MLTNGQIKAQIRAFQKQTRQFQAKRKLLAKLESVRRENSEVLNQLCAEQRAVTDGETDDYER